MNVHLLPGQASGLEPPRRLSGPHPPVLLCPGLGLQPPQKCPLKYSCVSLVRGEHTPHTPLRDSGVSLLLLTRRLLHDLFLFL